MSAIIRFCRQYLFQPIDGPLFFILSVIVIIGQATLWSACYDDPDRLADSARNLVLALLIMIVIANVPPEFWMRHSLPMYLLGGLLLVLVFVSGEIRKGAQRWLNLGIFSFQPAEIMKIVVPLMLAWYFDKHGSMLSVKNFAVAALILIVPVGLIAKQPDLGTAVLVGMAGFSVLFFAGLSWKIMAGLVCLFLLGAPVLWLNLFDYQKTRILTLLDPTRDPLGSGYHIIQSMIAVGSGGLLGKGWLEGTQTHLEFLPERHTDFIFAVFSEEFGLLGNLLFLTCYFLLIVRAFMIAARAKTCFSRLVASALGVILFMYAFVNIGMVVGLLPVVGVPLPFVSYGGTAMITLFVAVGLLMSIQRQKKLILT